MLCMNMKVLYFIVAIGTIFYTHAGQPQSTLKKQKKTVQELYKAGTPLNQLLSFCKNDQDVQFVHREFCIKCFAQRAVLYNHSLNEKDMENTIRGLIEEGSFTFQEVRVDPVKTSISPHFSPIYSSMINRIMIQSTRG